MLADDVGDVLTLGALGAGAYWISVRPELLDSLTAALARVTGAASVAPAPAPPLVGSRLVAPASAGLSQPATQQSVTGFALSLEAQIKLGLTLSKEITRWFLTPLQSAPTMGLSPEAAAGWAQYRIGERADYLDWVDKQLPSLDAFDLNAGENVVAATALETGQGLAPDAATALQNGTLEAAPLEVGLSNLTIATRAFGTAAALVDMGFTIAGNLPDAQKAVYTALDAATIAALYIPVYGWAIGLALGIVRMFMGSLFGPAPLSHAQREALEVQRTAEQGLNPWMQAVAAAYSPRELVDVLIRWGTGYCGGTSPVAVMTFLTAGPTESAYVGTPGCYINAGRRYRDWPDAAAMGRDDFALALVAYGATDTQLSVQAGVAQHFLDDLNAAGLDLLRKRLTAWAEMMTNGATLNDLDALALEKRQGPYWDTVAQFFGSEDWHALVGAHLQDLWTRYMVTSRGGSLRAFAALFGYPSWLALRDAVMVPYAQVATLVLDFDAALARYDGGSVWSAELPSVHTPSAALTARLSHLDARMAQLEQRCAAGLADFEAAQQAAALAAIYPITGTL